ncbi:restriction endonuclease subunit S [Cupriavidus sp. D39]|uniref:restriction endonuclease subunit S n=1 Tax=Cupriavidus sp. D39 TaxID=2997877 RepID=UPI002272231D|nr:restriction endonuclease subunit S [Cupriavidus sp. D39]MCY0856028.1 restriction endonuclease subunit S [Cupriavidus sp. D39]
MNSEWRECSLGEVVTLQRGMDLPVQDRKPGEFPVVASTGVVGYHDEAPVKGPGVVIGRSGSIGGGQYVECDFWPLNTTLWVKDFKGNDPRFCYYLLRSIDFSGMNAGSGVPTLNRNHLHPMPVVCPDLAEQTRIASLLGALDDRIALLHETNATLEAIAQVLFKSWFVDFDPVRAKAEGREPEGLDSETAALFPDGFEVAELGLVPKGWAEATLGRVCDEHGGTIQTGPFGSQLHASDYTRFGIPVVMPKDIANRRVNEQSIARIDQAEADRLARHKVQSGDIVFSRRGDVERHALISILETGWICGTGCLLVRPGSAWPSPTFLSMALDEKRARNWLVRHAVGATMPNLNTGILADVPILMPQRDVVAAFENIVKFAEEKRTANYECINVLAGLRDTLLPRLISGQIRLPEAEALLEDAA